MSICDNGSVGALITRRTRILRRRQWLLFQRATPPAGIACSAGHIDDHGEPEDAVRAEVREETGLTVQDLRLAVEGWLDNRCRRTVGPLGVGHHWWIYTVKVTGRVKVNAREARRPRWYTRRQIQRLADRTVLWANGRITDDQYAEQPGLEPAWCHWLHRLGTIRIPASDLQRVTRLANAPHTPARATTEPHR